MAKLRGGVRRTGPKAIRCPVCPATANSAEPSSQGYRLWQRGRPAARAPAGTRFAETCGEPPPGAEEVPSTSAHLAVWLRNGSGHRAGWLCRGTWRRTGRRRGRFASRGVCGYKPVSWEAGRGGAPRQSLGCRRCHSVTGEAPGGGTGGATRSPSAGHRREPPALPRGSTAPPTGRPRRRRPSGTGGLAPRGLPPWAGGGVCVCVRWLSRVPRRDGRLWQSGTGRDSRERLAAPPPPPPPPVPDSAPVPVKPASTRKVAGGTKRSPAAGTAADFQHTPPPPAANRDSFHLRVLGNIYPQVIKCIT